MKSTCDTAESEDCSVIRNGMYLLLQRADQERIVQFKEDESLGYGRGYSFQEIKLNSMNGCPFYSTFRIIPSKEKRKSKDGRPGGQLCHLELVENCNTNLIAQIIDPSSTSERNTIRSKDNRNLHDDGKSQQLGATDIASLREKGASGQQILGQLVTSSVTFMQKTEFSQEKYLKKKESKYGDTITVLKPTLDLIADYYFTRDPSKIMNLRIDTLSQMLSYANVYANGKYLIYETGCLGLLVASVLQRLGGFGVALHVHTGSTPQRQALHYMNFKKTELQPLKSLDVFYLIRPQAFGSSSSSDASKLPEFEETDQDEDALKANADESELEPQAKKFKGSEDEPPSVPADQEELADNGNTEDVKCDDDSGSAMSKFTSINRVENERSASLLQSTEFDGLLICAKEHPLSITQRLLPHLARSAPFAIFCQYSEPLIDCYNWIKDNNLGVNLNLVENWFRTIQVEVERTHPEINMSSNGGFLLFGTSVNVS